MPGTDVGARYVADATAVASGGFGQGLRLLANAPGDAPPLHDALVAGLRIIVSYPGE